MVIKNNPACPLQPEKEKCNKVNPITPLVSVKSVNGFTGDVILKNLSFGNKKFNGSNDIDLNAADLGLDNAFIYKSSVSTTARAIELVQASHTGTVYFCTEDKLYYLSTGDGDYKTIASEPGGGGGGGSGKIDIIKVNDVVQPIVNKTVNISVPVKTSDLTNDSGFTTMPEVEAKDYSTVTETGYKMTLSVASNYLTTQLLSKNNVLLDEQTVKLPEAAVVLDAYYDSEKNAIILVLQGGKTVEIPLTGLISGLVNKTEFNNHKNNTDVHTTADEKVIWNSKQEKINDLATIRSGASLGSTSVQQSEIGLYAKKTEVTAQIQSYHDDTKQDVIDKYLKNATVSGNTLTIKDDKGNSTVFTPTGTGEPAEYIKSASVNDNTLTLTRKDGSTLNFTPTGGGGGTSDYTKLANKPKINNVELDGNKSLTDLGISIPTKLSELTNDKGFIDRTALAPYSTIDDTGNQAKLTMNESNFVLTLKLLNANGIELSSSQVDLPLEEMIVNGKYDNTTKSIILTLKNGNTITIPVGDLVSGLVSNTTFNEHVNNDTHVSSAEKLKWNNKASTDYVQEQLLSKQDLLHNYVISAESNNKTLTLNVRSNDEAKTITFTPDGKPDYYLKSASVSGNTLTLKDQNDNSILFSGTEYNPGAGIEITDITNANKTIKLNSASLASLAKADTAVQPAVLTDYATQSWVTDKLSVKADKTEVDTKLTNYYTKTESDTLLAEKANKVYVDSKFENYYNKAESDTLLADKADKTELSNYYTKTQSDTLLADKASKNYVDTEIGKLYSNQEIDNMLSTKADTEYVDEKVGALYTNKQIDDKLDLKANVTDLAAKQNKLIAGENITIVGDTISATSQAGVTSITAGYGLTGGTITSTGTIAVDTTTIAKKEDLENVKDLFSEHKTDTSIHITPAERIKWNAKQDAISNLQSIIEGAALGSTAVQPSTMYTELSKKQNTLTAGDGITISNNVISSSCTLWAKYGETSFQELLDAFNSNKLIVFFYKNHQFSLQNRYLDTAPRVFEFAAVSNDENDTINNLHEVKVKEDNNNETVWSYKSYPLQGKLTAGANITIVDNVISSTGGGGGGSYTATDGVEIRTGNIIALTSEIRNTINTAVQPAALDNYATKTWVEDKNYLTEHQDISGKANISYVNTELAKKQDIISDISDIRTKANNAASTTQLASAISTSEAATKQWVEDKNYLTEHQDISGKANISYVDSSISTSETNTKQWVNNQGFIKTVSEYSMIKDTNPGEFAAIYHLTKDGVNVGAPIEINKDQLLKSVTVKTCTEKGVPLSNLEVGDKYLDFEFETTSGTSHSYIAVKDMVKAYTAGEGIFISSDNKISINTATLNRISSLETAIDTKQNKIDDLDYIRSGATLGATAVQPTAIADMATKTWVENKNYLTEHQDISGKADKTYVNTELAKKQDIISDLSTIRSGASLGATAVQEAGLSSAISTSEANTKTWVNNQGFLTSHQDISGKADKTYVDTELAKKQNTLTAGTNITIVDNIISATSSGGGTLQTDLTTNIKVGWVEAGTTFTAGTSLESIIRSILYLKPVLQSISITTPPTKTEYTIGETFDPTGMVVKANFNTGTSSPIFSYTYSPTTALTESDTQITISYTYEGVTKTTMQAITVKKPEVFLYKGATDEIPTDITGFTKISNKTKAELLANPLEETIDARIHPETELGQWVSLAVGNEVTLSVWENKDISGPMEFTTIDKGTYKIYYLNSRVTATNTYKFTFV